MNQNVKKWLKSHVETELLPPVIELLPGQG